MLSSGYCDDGAESLALYSLLPAAMSLLGDGERREHLYSQFKKFLSLRKPKLLILPYVGS